MNAGLNSFTFGVILIAVNLVVAALAIVLGVRRVAFEERIRAAAAARKAENVEWACNFDAVKFESTISCLQTSFCPPSNVLCFW